MDIEQHWEFVADRVMGGVSRGALSREHLAGRSATRLTGTVSLENNGGFLQMAFDLAQGSPFDASGFEGVYLDVIGNGEAYELRLRTDQLTRPWQSFRAGFVADPSWQRLRLPFAGFEANKTDAPFDPARLRRVGVLAYGRVFEADVAVAGIGFYP